MNTSSVRFFLGVSPHPPWVWAGFGAIVVLQGWTLRQSPDDAASMLAAALMLQMFAASTGFCSPASRGHFDPLLTSGRSRPALAGAHLLASALPGLVAWIVLAVIEVALAPASWPVALRPRPLLALALVSTITWALTLRLPRFSGGVLWMGLLFAAAITRERFLAYANRITARMSAFGAGDILTEAGVRAAVPFLLLDPRPTASEWLVFTFDVGVVLAVLAAALVFLSRRDYPLTEE